MIHNSDLEDLQQSVVNFERLKYSYKSTSSFDSQYQQWLAEAIDVLDEIFGERNKFTINIARKSDASYAFDLNGNVTKEVIETILGYLKAALKSAKRKKEKETVIENNQDPFIAFSRIEQLSKLNSERFDLSRLIRFCKEINIAKNNNSYLTIPLLIRSILDHIPPIFNCKSFNEVSNNYGSKSFKESMIHLNNSLRKIADSHLHTQIRAKESLPAFTQVNFSADLDVLLAEIVRYLTE